MRTGDIGPGWVLGVALLALLFGCSDEGDRLVGTPTGVDPAVDRLVPARTIVSDTVRVQGSGFGAKQESGLVTFSGTSGARLDAEVLGWSETELSVRVPAGAIDGVVRVSFAGEIESNETDFSVATREITFSGDLVPLFQANGCLGCHGGSGGLFLDTAENLLVGGNHGPAATPRASGESNIVRKLGPEPPFGSRMPKGCDTGDGCLGHEEILKVADWIDQGARDN